MRSYIAFTPLEISQGKKTRFLTGFTLVELMISVVILGFGLVTVIGAYLSALNGLEASQNYFRAMQFAQDKLTQIELLALQENGLSPGIETGKIDFASRQFNWQTEITPVVEPEYLAEDFQEVKVSLFWQERNRKKETALVTYLPQKKEEEEEEGDLF